MNNIEIFEYDFWFPFKRIGLNSSLLYINSGTVINTWIVLAILFIILLILNFSIKRNNQFISYLLTMFIKSFKDLSVQSIGTFIYKHFAIVTSLFIFIFFCNSISLIPGMEEPTTDLNTTLSLGLISFFYIQVNAISVHGLKKYIKDYFSPFFILFPLNVIGKLSSIVSISFRLFGNVFGGSIISKIYLSFISGSIIFETIGLLSGINFLIIIFFGLFEGFIQAFVFAMLTMTYLSVAIQSEKEIV